MRFVSIVLLIICGNLCAQDTLDQLSDQEILDYARQPYDKMAKMLQQTEILGAMRGTVVRVDYICSDECPAYTVRVIRLEVGDDLTCSDAGGIEKELWVPESISSVLRTFCFPGVLVENWDQYLK